MKGNTGTKDSEVLEVTLLGRVGKEMEDSIKLIHDWSEEAGKNLVGIRRKSRPDRVDKGRRPVCSKTKLPCSQRSEGKRVEGEDGRVEGQITGTSEAMILL